MNWRKGIFVPQRWMDIVAKSSKRFIANSMENQDFIPLQSSDERYVQKVKGISIIQWLRFHKPDPDTLFYKKTFNHGKPDHAFRSSCVPNHTLLESKPWNPRIYKDLLSLYLQLIQHAFYRDLKSERGLHQPRRRVPEPVEGENIDENFEDAAEVEPDYILCNDSD